MEDQTKIDNELGLAMDALDRMLEKPKSDIVSDQDARESLEIVIKAATLLKASYNKQ